MTEFKGIQKKEIAEWKVGDKVKRLLYMDDGTWEREGDSCLDKSPYKYGVITKITKDFGSLWYRNLHVKFEDGSKSEYLPHGIERDDRECEVKGDIFKESAFRSMLLLLTDGGMWPDSYEEQVAVLKKMENRIRIWRTMMLAPEQIVNADDTQDRLIKHQKQQITSLRKKLKNVRKAMREYMKDQIAYLRKLKEDVFFTELLEPKEFVATWECVVTARNGDDITCDAYLLDSDDGYVEFWDMKVPGNKWDEGHAFYVLKSKK